MRYALFYLRNGYAVHPVLCEGCLVDERSGELEERKTPTGILSGRKLYIFTSCEDEDNFDVQLTCAIGNTKSKFCPSFGKWQGGW